MTGEQFSGDDLYRQFYPKVCAYVRSKVQNPHDAEELVSLIFLKLTQKISSFDAAKASLATWVYAVARNTVTDFYRTHRSFVALEDYMLDTVSPGEISSDALDALADALLALKEKERDLIVLHYYQGHTLKTVADMMGMSYINAKVIHKKALISLRAFYQAM